MKEEITITPIPATPGYFVVYLVQNNNDKAKPFTKDDVCRVPVVGWLINNEKSTWGQGKKESKYERANRGIRLFEVNSTEVWAEPICCEIAHLHSGISLFILSPDGSVMEPECAIFESIDKWITNENEEKRNRRK